MNELEQYFRQNTDRLIHKWQHYFEIYDRHLKQYRGKDVVLLELGVFQGGSLQMWKHYLGPKAKIYGIDINPDCKAYEEENIEIFIGSQSDRTFLSKIREQIPHIDIVIDDGGHTMNQMRVSFDELFHHVKKDGIYIVEDLHTCYWIDYGGGYKRMGSFIEYSKNFIDYINAWHSKQASLKVNEFTQTIHSVHFYDSILAIEKREMTPPFQVVTGKQVGDPFAVKKKSLGSVLIRKTGRALNTVLQLLRLPSIPKI